jgi:hypothetical protein
LQWEWEERGGRDNIEIEKKKKLSTLLWSENKSKELLGGRSSGIE